jgi:hypothetical protein
VVVAAPVAADSVTLLPVRDNTLYENAVGGLSNGAGEHLFAGITALGLSRRAVLAFDVAGGVPPGATITGVELTLHMSMTIAPPQTVRLHRLQADWGEGSSDAFGREGAGAPATPGDATWLHTFFNTGFWSVAGGDFDPSPSAEQTVAGDGYYTWFTTPALVADVQAWLDDPAANHGWIVVGDESTEVTAKRFDSREHFAPELRPSLTVEYAATCDPAPVSQGYWHRQCLGVPASDGGIDPPGRGPVEPTEPGFVDELMPCADAILADLGLGETTCQGMDADPPADKCEKALKQTTALVLNLCSGRLQPFCPVEPGAVACESETVGALLEEIAASIVTGDCRRAADCAEAVNGGEAVAANDESPEADEPARAAPRAGGRGLSGATIDNRGLLRTDRGGRR